MTSLTSEDWDIWEYLTLLSTGNKSNWLAGIINIPTQEVNFDIQPLKWKRIKNIVL